MKHRHMWEISGSVRYSLLPETFDSDTRECIVECNCGKILFSGNELSSFARLIISQRS